MKKFLFVVIVFGLFQGFIQVAGAVDFEANSATITNRYLPAFPGGNQTLKGYGSLNGTHDYTDFIGTEIVDGVACQRLVNTDLYNSWYSTIWFAQALDGGIYLLKVLEVGMSAPIVIGKTNAVLFMPDSPIVGGRIFDTGSNYQTVLDLNATVAMMSTGMGPFTGCLKAQEEDGDINYYAPGYGLVKKEYASSYGGKELMEINPQLLTSVCHIPHITSGYQNWSDYLQVTNTGKADSNFTVTLFADGVSVYSQELPVPGNSQSIIDLKEIAPTAVTGIVTYTDNRLHFRYSTQNEGGGVAELELPSTLFPSIGLYFSDFTPSIVTKGAAIANFSTSTVNVTLRAEGNGILSQVYSTSIGPRDKIIGTWEFWFPGSQFSDIKTIVVVSDSPSLCGFVISGDADLSHLLTTPAVGLAIE